KEWLKANSSRVILLQIRDTRAHEIFPMSQQNTWDRMIFEHITVMTERWEPFQSFAQDHLKDIATAAFGEKLSIIPIEFIPVKEDRHVALNFHLTAREKQELLHSVNGRETQIKIQQLMSLLQ